jgi:hypothetical protein
MRRIFCAALVAFAALRPLSQEAQAEAVDVTVQQIQKYDKGVQSLSTAAFVGITRAL